jgi:acyl-CoA thioester hydrolase
MSIPIYTTTVSPEWIDYNGHMRDGYYGLVLSLACDAMMDRLGMHADYRQRTQCTLYTLEQHLHFLHEVMLSDRLDIEVRILAADAKRIHAAFDCRCTRYPDPVASGELMLLHVSQAASPAAAPFPDDIAAAIETLRQLSAQGTAPALSSRRMELRPAR